MNHKCRVLIYTLLAVALALLATGEQSSLAEGITIYVDADATGANNGTSWEDAFTTLQPAMNAAVSGDQIWVAEGTYTPTEAHGGKGRRYRSFQLENGVALFGGFDPSEGAVTWEDRDWISHVTILSGDLKGDDGPDFARIKDNSYHVFYHPAELGLNETAILDGFTIRGGNANGTSPHFYGGGMLNIGSSPTINNVTFDGNWAYDGGGMFNWDNASPLLTNCTFLGNHAEWSGGGIINTYYSSPTLKDCTFISNFAGTAGGGLNNTDYSSPIMTNTLFWGNASENGGGMHNYNSFPVLTNITFANNTASYGGAMRNYAGANPVLTNAILWGNTPDQINGDPATVTYSDVQGGYPGTGNINTDPQFMDAVSGDFHLSPGSPCIDAGSNDAPYLPEYDFEGDPRILDGDFNGIATVDMGVDETTYEPPPIVVYYVDQDATGENNGTSWADAFTTLQPALDAAERGGQVWVAEGTYTPTWEFSPGDPRSVSFQMKNGVAIFGGFAGFESNLGERDWISNVTILTCDLFGNDEPIFINNGENCYHVFYHPEGTALGSSAILDGFLISGGNANGAYYHDGGGGMNNGSGNSPTLMHIIFSANWGTLYGGGMSTSYSNPILINVTFADNMTDFAGGGMFNSNSNSTLTDVVFTGNSAHYGGGMYNYTSNSILTDVSFTSNTAVVGGGLYNSTRSNPILNNSSFVGNYASIDGGGLTNHNQSQPELVNCTFTGNAAVSSGGGIYNFYYSSAVVTNSILWGDTPNEIYLSDSTLVITYSNVQGSYTGEGNLNIDPLFLDPAIGDFHLSSDSPVIDMGINTATNLPWVDFEGDPRILDGNGDGTAIVDMGVDEYNPQSAARLEDTLIPRTGQEHNKPGLTSFTGGFIAILAAIGVNVAIPALARKRSARDRPR